MGFTYEADTTLELEIEGKTYRCPIDSPEFIAYWQRNHSWFEQVSKYQDYTQEQIESMPQEEVDDVSFGAVRLTAELVVALLGTEAAQGIFNGRERSLMFCTELSNYIYTEMDSQGLIDKITRATRKYSSAKVIDEPDN